MTQEQFEYRQSKLKQIIEMAAGTTDTKESQALLMVAIAGSFIDVAEIMQNIAVSLEKLANPPKKVYSDTPEQLAEMVMSLIRSGSSSADIRGFIEAVIKQERELR